MNIELSKRILSSLILIPVTFFCIFKGSYFFSILILILFFFTCYEWWLMVKINKFKYFGIIFLIFSYLTIFFIRNGYGEQSLYLFFYVILICISSDLGGYIFGKLLKGPKLTKISPNKTYAGVLGALILSNILLVIFAYNSHIVNVSKIIIDLKFFVIVSIVSVVSQLGDLVISYFKRLNNFKDTGNIIPGHGGILDRTDGMIFAFPFFFILLSFNLIQ